MAQGVIPLRWLANGPASLATVRLEYSANDGHNWEVIATNLSASAGLYLWDTFRHHDSKTGTWRIISEAETNVSDEIDFNFAVASGPQIAIPASNSGLVLQWYGQTGRLYRVFCPTEGLDDSWTLCPNLTFTNGSLFLVATGANRNIVAIDTNISANASSFYGISASDP
jgi:hypothetical protein